MTKRFLTWLPLGFVLTVLCSLIYVGLQQQYRANANDPQIQMAEDAATQLRKGEAVTTVMTSSKIDLATSLAPFLIMYDDQGKVVASTVSLVGQTPQLPASVTKNLEPNGETRITWAPESDVRVAAVIKRFEEPKVGYILVGRSLREVENRIAQLGMMTFAVWVASLALSLLYFMLLPRKLID